MEMTVKRKKERKQKKKKQQNNNNVTKKDFWRDKEPQKKNTSTTFTKLTKAQYKEGGLHMQIYTQLSNVRVVGAEHIRHFVFIDGLPANHL